MEALDQLKNLRTGSLNTHPPVQPERTSQVKVVLSADEYKEQMFRTRLEEINTLKRIERMLYDYSNPVDEYITIPTGVPSANPLVIQPDYDRLELYTSMLYCLPLGITSATLAIGTSRTIQLYNGAANATQDAIFLNGLTILAGPDDKRTLTIVGTATSQGYFGMMGHCYDREGTR